MDKNSSIIIRKEEFELVKTTNVVLAVTEKIIEENNTNLFNQGFKLLNKKNKFYEDLNYYLILKENPDFFKSLDYETFTVNYHKKEDIIEAKKIFELFVKQNPNSEIYIFLFSLSCYYILNSDVDVSIVSKVLEIDPTFIAARELRAIINYYKKDRDYIGGNYTNAMYTKALVDLDYITSNGNNDVRFFVHKYYCYRNLDKHEKSLEVLNTALSLRPDYSLLYSLRSNVYRQLYRYNEALLDHYQHVLTNIDNYTHWDNFERIELRFFVFFFSGYHSENEHNLNLFKELYKYVKDYNYDFLEVNIEGIEKIIKSGEFVSLPYLSKAVFILLHQINDQSYMEEIGIFKKVALEALNIAKEKDPLNSYLYILYSDYYFLLNKYSEALKEIDNAEKYSTSEDSYIYFSKYLIYKEIGDYENSQTNFSKFKLLNANRSNF